MDLVLKNNFLAPEEKKTFEYSGNHPSRLLKEVPNALKDTLKVEGSKVYEESVSWDASGSTIFFAGSWKANLPKDDFSKIWVHIKVQGNQSKQSKSGNAKVFLTGWLETKFEYNAFIQKAFLTLYSFVFYSNQRLKYINEGKIYMSRVEDMIRVLFGVVRK